MNRLQRTVQKGKALYSKLTDKKYTTISGTLVYFFIMSILPFSVWLSLLFGRLMPDLSELYDLELFSEFKDLFLYVQESARGATTSISVVFLATSLYSASGLFYHMRKSGEIIYDYTRKKGGLKVRLAAVALLFLMAALLSLAVGILLFGNAILAKFLPAVLRKLILNLMLLVIAFGVLVILNLYICPYRLKLRDVALGSLISAALWFIAAYAFRIYLYFSGMTKFYGAIAVVILFLLWLYVMTVCFIVGVIFNCYRIPPDKEHKKF